MVSMVVLNVGCDVWDKLLKGRRGCLLKLRPRESLKPRDFSDNFSDDPKAFQQFVRLWFPRDAGTDLP